MRSKLIPSLLSFLFFLAQIPLPLSAQPQFVQGQVVSISIRLVDENGDPISGITVHFYDETDGVELGTDVTDAEGYASISWDTSSASIGPHLIRIYSDPGQYVEAAETTTSIEIIAPAELSLEISGPSAVKPGEKFQVTVSVLNSGGPTAQGVVASQGDQHVNLGDIAGGGSAQASFSIKAPTQPGDYSVAALASATEEGTGRQLSAQGTYSYSVLKEGLSVSVEAPPSVKALAGFEFSVTVRNLGETALDVSLTVSIEGGEPNELSEEFRLSPRASKTLDFSATAGTGEWVTIEAVASSGDITASSTAKVMILALEGPEVRSVDVKPNPADPEEGIVIEAVVDPGERPVVKVEARLAGEVYEMRREGGRWAVNATAPSLPGEYSVVVVARDDLGNEGYGSGQLTVRAELQSSVPAQRPPTGVNLTAGTGQRQEEGSLESPLPSAGEGGIGEGETGGERPIGIETVVPPLLPFVLIFLGLGGRRIEEP